MMPYFSLTLYRDDIAFSRADAAQPGRSADHHFGRHFRPFRGLYGHTPLKSAMPADYRPFTGR